MCPIKPLETVHWYREVRGHQTFNTDDLGSYNCQIVEHLFIKYGLFDNLVNPQNVEAFLRELVGKKTLVLVRITETKAYWSFEYNE